MFSSVCLKTVDCDIMDKESVHAKIKLTVLATGVLLLAQVHRKSNVVHICIHGCYFDPNITTSTKGKYSCAVAFPIFPVIRRESGRGGDI